MRTAAIGIGSNSLRMLLAEIENGQLHRLRRYREGLRTFAALDGQGNIDQKMIRLACKKVGGFAQKAQKGGAQTIHLFATSAVRDAKNQRAFIQAIEDATSLPVDVCSGEVEARLSFIGATGKEPSGLIDIGGGSTEIACGQGKNVVRAVSLQMGAVRLYRKLPIVDGDTARQVVALAAGILAPVKRDFLNTESLQWIGVGGTFTAAAALAQGIHWNDRQRIHQYTLTRERVEEILLRLAPMSVKERLSLPSMQPQRADIVAHGIAILLALMRELAIPCIQVSEWGNLEGYLKLKYLCS